jgi:hypothetical protein
MEQQAGPTRAATTRAGATRAATTRADTTRADTTRADTTRADTTRADTTRAGAMATGTAVADRAGWAADRAARTVGLAGKTAGWAGHAVLGAAQSLPGVPAVLGRARHLPAAASLLQDAVTPILTGRVDDWRSVFANTGRAAGGPESAGRTEYAYALGLQAFIYGFPYIRSAEQRHDWAAGAPADGGCPDVDTVYSAAWLDLTGEPVIISYPKAAGRSVTFDLVDFAAETFDRIGTTRQAAGRGTEHIAVTGPGWKGKLPAGVRRARRAPTPWVLVLGRFLASEPAGLRSARTWQRQTTLTPLSQWGRSRARTRTSAERPAVYAPAGQGSDPLAPWRTLNAMLAQNPPPRRHALLLDQFATIGVGPGLDVDAQPDVIKRGLRRAASVGLPLLRQQFTSISGPAVRDGWRYPQHDDGHLAGDFLSRAADRSLAGLTADRGDIGYAIGLADSGGVRLSPHGSYSLRFGPGELPPAGSWSLTAYTEPDLNPVRNRAGRCSVSDRAPDLRRDQDGGLTIYLRPTWPGRAREANWLPTSPDQPWFVILRRHRPRRQPGSGWQAPAIRLLG